MSEDFFKKYDKEIMILVSSMIVGFVFVFIYFMCRNAAPFAPLDTIVVDRLVMVQRVDTHPNAKIYLRFDRSPELEVNDSGDIYNKSYDLVGEVVWVERHWNDKDTFIMKWKSRHE